MRERLPALNVPGLNDHIPKGRFLFGVSLRKHGVHMKKHNIGWKEGRFEPKMQSILDEIDRMYNRYGVRVAVVGDSAGGAPTARALALRPNKVSCAVLLCAEIENPANVALRFADNPAFKESMDLVPDTKRRLHDLGRTQDILSLRPAFDPKVPPEDTIVPGADNRLVESYGYLPTKGHAASIMMMYAFGAADIAEFIKARTS